MFIVIIYYLIYLIKPRGGVASLLAQSSKKSFDELRAELVKLCVFICKLQSLFNQTLTRYFALQSPTHPKLRGEIYSYLSLSISTNLGVHLNGDFSLSSARRGILQSETDLLQTDCDDAKRWNIYILNEVL